MIWIPTPQIYYYRCCDNCAYPYRWRDEHDWVNERKKRYCLSCDSTYIKNMLLANVNRRAYNNGGDNIKIPKELIEIKRLQIAGKRLLKLELEDYQIEILTQISKTEDHESRTIAQSIIRNFVRPKKRQSRTTNGKDNFQRGG